MGMAQDFYRESAQAKEVFEEANSVLNFDLAGLIFKGPLEELTKTANCQTAIFTASVAILRALEVQNPAVNVKYTAGLSLGEYTAIVAAEALSFAEALKLVSMRAKYMDEAAKQNPGGMVSLIGLSLDAVAEICARTKVEIANLNCPGQTVISGSPLALEKAKELAEAQGAKRTISLNVAGAFHSNLMFQAGQKLNRTLEEVQIRPAKIPIISNVSAAEENSPEEIKENLARQVTSRVLWEDSIRFIAAQGINHFFEIGPGRVLKGLLRKIDPNFKVYNIETVQNLEELRKEHSRCC